MSMTELHYVSLIGQKDRIIERQAEEIARLQQLNCQLIRKDELEIIEALRAENAKLREALKPFADRAKYAEKYESERIMWPVAIGDLRAARAVMGESDEC